MPANKPIIQPYMFQPHPGYRMQLKILDRFFPERLCPTFPADNVEHARWQHAVPWQNLENEIKYFLTMRHRPDIFDVVVGPILPIYRRLVPQIRKGHLDVDDIVSFFSAKGDRAKQEKTLGSVARAILAGVRQKRLSISFWTEIQCKNFLALLSPQEVKILRSQTTPLVIPPAIPAQLSPSALGGDNVLRCLCLSCDESKFWHKGIADAITAVSLAAKENIPIKLTLVGNDLPLKWRDYVRGQRFIEVLPRLSRQDLDSVYRKNDLVLFLSHHDTFGWVILEAKSFGLPTIVTDFYNRTELVQHEVNGMVVADPFNNRFLPLKPYPYAAPYLDIDGSQNIVVDPLLSKYFSNIVEHLALLQKQKTLLRDLGRKAYADTGAQGRFNVEEKLEALRPVLADIHG